MPDAQLCHLILSSRGIFGISPILQMKKLRLIMVSCLAEGPTISGRAGI